jgi:DNA repair protein RadA/Sms
MGYGGISKSSELLLLSDVNESVKPVTRYSTGVLDSVLGGGLVSDSVTLLVGPPGIGKSTLSLQVAAELSQQNLKVLYIAGEETAAQIKARANRLGTDCSKIYVLQSCDIAKIAQTIKKLVPDVFIVDSLQTIEYLGLASAPGSPKQMELCATELNNIAKEVGAAAIMLGHIVKAGHAAGPKKIEHIVDAVVRFEKKLEDRIVFCTKNRFGTTDEVCILTMENDGLHVAQSSHQLIEEPGTVFTLFEHKNNLEAVAIQSAISYYAIGRLECSFYSAKELSKLTGVFANMEMPVRRWHINVSALGHQGKLKDADAELGLYASILAAHTEHNPEVKVAALGSVSLSGSVLPCKREEERISLALSMGFDKVVGNFASSRQDSRIVRVQTVREIVKNLSF